MLRIGDFARLGRVTVKAVRHYDEAGLLRPVHVDPAAGYRYYSAEQLEVLGRILQLKDFGFGLKEIGRLLGDPEALRSAVWRRRAELEAEIAGGHARLRRLDAFRDTLAAEPEPLPVLLRAIEPVTALTRREVVRSGDGSVTALFEQLEAGAAKAGARADASPFLLFHDPAREDRLDVEVCVPVKPEAAQLGGARLVEGSAQAGAVVYRGPYAQTPALFAELARWIEANGGTIGGPVREVYHRFGADQRGYRLPRRVLAEKTADYVTELQAPIALEAAP